MRQTQMDRNKSGRAKNGELITIKGYWSDIYVREGDDWKIRVTANNITPDSVLLINKSLHNNRLQRRPRPPALAPNKLATKLSTTSHSSPAATP
jgi:hypothetical protein